MNDRIATEALRTKLRAYAKDTQARALPHPSTYFTDKTLADYAAYFADRSVPTAKLVEAVKIVETRIADAARGVSQNEIDEMFLTALRKASMEKDGKDGMCMYLVEVIEESGLESERAQKLMARTKEVCAEFDGYIEWMRVLGPATSPYLRKNYAGVLESFGVKLD